MSPERSTASERAAWRWAGVVPAALAACAGGVDLLALAGLGGAFASIVTGNLVTTGYGIGTADVALAAPPGISVVCFTVGVVASTRVWRHRPEAVIGLLLAELVLLAGVAAGWILTGAHPGPVVSFVLLGAASAAMGGQSVAALRLKASTTYMTGTLVSVLQDVVTGRAGRRRSALRQLAALVAGACAAAALLHPARWAVPLLPLVLLAVSIGLVVADRPAIR
jgi:uncharacterized membrane protein YoaK (UPF0700 family)